MADSTEEQSSSPSKAPYPPPRPPRAGGIKGTSPFYSISDNSTGAETSGTAKTTTESNAMENNARGMTAKHHSAKRPSSVSSHSGKSSRGPSPYPGRTSESRAGLLYHQNVAQNVSESMEEVTGLRRRHPAASERAPSPERDGVHAQGVDRRRTSTPGGGPSVLGALGRGVLGVSKWTLGSLSNQLGPPFAWAEFMFAWVREVTPPRLKRLAIIFWDAGAHITKLAYTSGGEELGFAARNVIDGLVETIAAPKGRAFVLEGGMTFVKFAEAVDTPEMHAAITQGFKLGSRGLEVLATEQAKDFLSNVSDFLSRLVRLANAPETTLAVAEFVTVVCHALAQENAAYSRERVSQLSPFEGAGEGGEEEEEEREKGGEGPVKEGGKKKKKGMRIVKNEDGERLEWDEDLVLGRKGGREEEGEEGKEAGDESGTTASSDTPSSWAKAGSEGEGGGGGEGVEGDLLPIQDGEMEDMLGARWGGRGEGRLGRVGADKASTVKSLVEAILDEKRAAAEARTGGGVGVQYKTEQERAARCALSFLFFITYTIFALIGIRASIGSLTAAVGGYKRG